MKNYPLSIALFTLFALFHIRPATAQSEIFVEAGGTGDGSALYPTDFQTALDMAASDGTDSHIFLKSGDYTDPPYLYGPSADGGSLLIRGSFNSDYSMLSEMPSSFLDGGGSNRCLDFDATGPSEAYTVTVDRLAIQNGRVSGANGAAIRFVSGDGGQMVLAVNNCVFTDNMAMSNGSGGAVYANASLQIASCTFEGNEAYNGGAVFSAVTPLSQSPTMTSVMNSQFRANKNYGNQGSTIWTNTQFIMKDSVLEGQSDGSVSGNGSPLWGNSGARLEVSRCVFKNFNINYWGSAIQTFDGDILVDNSLFTGNHSGTIDGYGVIAYFHNNGPENRLVYIANCTFVGNSAGAGNGLASCVHFRGDMADYASINNCIFYSNGSNSIYAQTGSSEVSYSLVDGGYLGFVNMGGNTAGNPGFVSGVDFHLTAGSSCHNSGFNSAEAGQWDLDGGVRKLGDTIDRGCYEFNYAPESVTLSPSSIDENEGGQNYLVGTLTTSEPEGGDSFSYDLVWGDGVNDADNDLFSIVNGGLYTNVTPDFESKSAYAIYLKTTDSYNQSHEQALVIDVIDLNEVPELMNDIPDQSGQVAEPFFLSVPANTFSDPDLDDDLVLSASLSDGNDLPGWLVFDGVTFSGTPLTEGVHSIRLRATDSGGLFADDIFELSVLPVGLPDLTAPGWCVFPNPAQNEVTIVVSSLTWKSRAFLYDSHGRLANSFWLQPGPNRLSVDEYGPGVYTVNIPSQNKTMRFVVR